MNDQTWKDFALSHAETLADRLKSFRKNLDRIKEQVDNDLIALESSIMLIKNRKISNE
jgi:flagellar hook-associated protein FlgK